jgi:hypothetical protein
LDMTEWDPSPAATERFWREMATDMSSGKTINDCLKSVGVALANLSSCSTVDEEWKIIKKSYYKIILEAHPDKGGDPEVFLDANTAFHVLRKLFESKFGSFTTSGQRSAMSDYNAMMGDMSGKPMPSWDYFESAAEEDMPIYRVELAKSGRSICKANWCGLGGAIGKGAIRVGSIDKQSGSYTRFCHLSCWRVPSKVWLGLDLLDDEQTFLARLLAMNEVLLCGLSELSEEDQRAVAQHAMNKSHWARPSKSRTGQVLATAAAAAAARAAAATTARAAAAAAAAASPPPRGIPATASQVAKSPNPPAALALATPALAAATTTTCVLAGKTVVLTGVFPELGGGSGLDLGKARARALVEAHGGRVTSAVSGRTDILLVGREPGFAKVSAAQRNLTAFAVFIALV